MGWRAMARSPGVTYSGRSLDPSGGEPVELRHYLSVLRRRAVLLLIVVLVALATAWIATPKDKTFSAQTVVYVGSSSFGVTGTEQYRYDPTLLVERLMTTYADMLHSEPVAESALQLTGVP